MTSWPHLTLNLVCVKAVDCERIVSLLGPLVRYQSPALRLLHASTFLMRHYERFCYVCGRVHDLPAEVETQVGPPAS